MSIKELPAVLAVEFIALTSSRLTPLGSSYKKGAEFETVCFIQFIFVNHTGLGFLSQSWDAVSGSAIGQSLGTTKSITGSAPDFHYGFEQVSESVLCLHSPTVECG